MENLRKMMTALAIATLDCEQDLTTVYLIEWRWVFKDRYLNTTVWALSLVPQSDYRLLSEAIFDSMA